MTENEMVGWHHQLNRHEFEQALGDGEGLWSLGLQRVGHNWETEEYQREITTGENIYTKNKNMPIENLKCHLG